MPDVDVNRGRYAMNIIMPSSEETDEFRLTFESVSPSLSLSYLMTLFTVQNNYFTIYIARALWPTI